MKIRSANIRKRVSPPPRNTPLLMTDCTDWNTISRLMACSICIVASRDSGDRSYMPTIQGLTTAMMTPPSRPPATDSRKKVRLCRSTAARSPLPMAWPTITEEALHSPRMNAVQNRIVARVMAWPLTTATPMWPRITLKMLSPTVNMPSLMMGGMPVFIKARSMAASSRPNRLRGVKRI